MESNPGNRPIIALFTSFHPDIGGGSVHLRNAIEHLPEFEVRWFYLGRPGAQFSGAKCIGQSELGGSLWRDLRKAVPLWLRGHFAASKALLEQIRECGARMVWVVAMGEGIAAGNAALDQLALPVHVTVHDDPARTLAGRSRRYRWLAPWVQKAFVRLVGRAQSVDVISEAMQQFYSDELGLRSIVFYRHLPGLPVMAVSGHDSSALWLGHIGAVYGEKELVACLKAFGEVCRQRAKRCGVRFFGESRFGASFMQRHLPEGALVEVSDTTPEAVAVSRLATCDLVWAMYPFDDRSAMFRQTSLPTKVSSYLQVQRPIFAQSPPGSTLDILVSRHGLGAVAAEPSVEAAVSAIQQTLDAPVAAAAFERARQALSGYDNVERLRASFCRLLTDSAS